MNIRIIPAGMICDDNFIMPTSVAITSMIKNKLEYTQLDIFVIMAECSEVSKRKIGELRSLCDSCEVHVLEVGLEKYRRVKQLAHISIACLLKFDLCDLIPQYDKILYLDGDIIVRGDLWELYSTQLNGKYAAAVKELQCINNGKSNINAGIMLFNAKRIRDEKLCEKLYDTRISLGNRGSMDQQSFNIVIGEEYEFISIKYNCILEYLTSKSDGLCYDINDINKLYNTSYSSKRELINQAVIYHFATGNKPWVYTFNEGAREWYKYYMVSPFKDVPFKLKSRTQYRIDKMIKAYRDKGVTGMVDRIAKKINRLSKSNDSNNAHWE